MLKHLLKHLAIHGLGFPQSVFFVKFFLAKLFFKVFESNHESIYWHFLVLFRVVRHGNKTHVHGYPSKPTPIWRVFSDLTGFGYEFGFSPISKYRYGTSNRDIRTHPEPIPKPYPNVERSYFCFCWGGWWWYAMLFGLIIVMI